MEMQILPLIAVLILNKIIPMIWYSPKVFGSTWAKAMHFKMDDCKPTPLHYASSTAVNIIAIAVTYILIRRFHIHTIQEALETGFLLWTGFIATSHLSGVIWAKIPFKVYLINVTNQLIVILLNFTLLAVWR